MAWFQLIGVGIDIFVNPRNLACMYLSVVILLTLPVLQALPKGLVSPPWMNLEIWKSCDNMPCIKGYVCVMHKSPEYTGPLCVKAGISTCMNVKCTAGFHCIHEEVVCVKAPCYPQPKCVPDEGQGSYKVPPPYKDKDFPPLPPTEDVPCVLPCPLHQTCRHVGGTPTCIPYNNGEDACTWTECQPTARCILTQEGNAQCVIDDGSSKPDTVLVGCKEGHHLAETLDGPRCIPDVLPPPPVPAGRSY